ncbi:MAG TPA: glycosyltransferase family 4 protein [Solirubrobacterales bacterium]|jgi:glycosyltransferase involved in cell wall biosynthesis
MRVLTVGNMYPPHHLGGYELIWRSAVERMRAEGHEVRVLTTGHREADPDPAIAEDSDICRGLRWYWRDHRFPRLGYRERLRIERHNLALLDREIAEFRPRLISWWAMGGLSLSLLARARSAGVPAAGVVIDEWLVYGPRVDGWQRAFSRPLLGQLAQATTGVPTGIDLAGSAEWIFASAYLRRQAVAAGIAVADCEVVHPGVDPGVFPQAPESEWRGRLLCLGRIDPRKGVETAIRALPELADCTLRCVGSGDPAHLDELRLLAERLAVAERVRFERLPRAKLASAYADADALAFCVSWQEPFGLVPLESMAVGRPVIATGTGGSGEYLRDGDNCLLTAPGDSAALAAAVLRLASEPELRRRLRRSGLGTAADHSEARFNEAILAAHERVAS